MDKKEIYLNGKKISEKKLDKKKEEVKEMSNARLVELSPNNFKIRLLD